MAGEKQISKLMGAYFTIQDLWEWFRIQDVGNQGSNGGGDHFIIDENGDELIDENGDNIVYQ